MTFHLHKKKNKTLLKNSFILILSYLLFAVFGLVVTTGLATTLPGFFEAIPLVVPLGLFLMGTGIDLVRKSTFSWSEILSENIDDNSPSPHY